MNVNYLVNSLKTRSQNFANFNNELQLQIQVFAIHLHCKISFMAIIAIFSELRRTMHLYVQLYI